MPLGMDHLVTPGFIPVPKVTPKINKITSLHLLTILVFFESIDKKYK